jgi:hypothetical protein
VEEFMVGDRVELVGVPLTNLKYGVVVDKRLLYRDPDEGDVPVHFDTYNYKYITDIYGYREREGWDFHSFRSNKFKLTEPKKPDWIL